MKNVKKLILNIALFLGSATLAIAGGDVPNIKISKSGLAKLSLIMEDMSLSTEATIKIEDKNGYALISEKVKKTNNFAKIFNLKNLPSGSYNIVINTQTRVTIQPINLKGNDIEIDTNKRKVVFHPVIRKNGSALDISWLAGKITNVKVSIQKYNGVSVFEDSIKNVFKVEKRYNVAQLLPGVYTVAVKTPYDTYFEEIVID